MAWSFFKESEIFSALISFENFSIAPDLLVFKVKLYISVSAFRILLTSK